MASANSQNKQEVTLIGEPLDKLAIQVNRRNGVQAIVPALSIGFMEKKYYLHFKPPPFSTDDLPQELTADEEEWLERIAFYEDDLHWLLKLPYHRFWSQVIFDEDLHKFLESYLALAPRDYELRYMNIRKELMDSLQTVHKLVFLVYHRMSIFKESKLNHISPGSFGEMIYENYLFDVPKIMEICILYGDRNKSLVFKMVENIFNMQPNYLNDLKEASNVILKAFNTIEEKLFDKAPNKDNLEEYFYTIKNISLHSLKDVINFILDTSATLSTFLDVYSSSSICDIFYVNNYPVKLSLFYEQVFPALENEIRKIQDNENEKIISEIKEKISLSKSFLVKLFRTLIYSCCIGPVLTSKPEDENSHAEEYMFIFIEIATYKRFLNDYNSVFPLILDISLFEEDGINLDPERIKYIYSCLSDDLHDTESCKIVNDLQSFQNIQPFNFNGVNEKNLPNEPELHSLIQSVAELFPDISDGFIEHCLQHYNYDAESVIDAILNSKLPESLAHLDRNMKREEIKENSYQQNHHESLLEQRKNIFDGDEFDIFKNENVNIENIHLGKSSKTPQVYDSLKSDKDSELLKQLTLLSNTDDDDDNEKWKLDLYDDEYDDTYDSMMVGVKEPAPEGEPEPDESPEDKQDNDENNISNTVRQPKPEDFCINPEIIRQKREENRQAKALSRNRGNNSNFDTGHNRQQKDRHKAQVANHNRRKESDFKRSRGLIPNR